MACIISRENSTKNGVVVCFAHRFARWDDEVEVSEDFLLLRVRRIPESHVLAYRYVRKMSKYRMTHTHRCHTEEKSTQAQQKVSSLS